MPLIQIILAISILLQATSAVMALRLIRITNHYPGWIALAMAAGFMAIRRIVSFYSILTEQNAASLNIAAETIALIISILILTGIIYIRPILQSLYASKANLEKTNKKLKAEIINRKIAEKEALTNEEKFRKLAEHSPIFIWMSDQSGLCTYFNKRWLNFTGRTIEEEKGMGWTEGLHADDKDSTIQNYLKAFSKRETFTLEYRLKNRNNEYHWLYDKGSPMHDHNGAFLGYIGSCIDITEKKKVEEELKQSEESFKKIVNSLPQFVSYVDKDLIYRLVNKTYLERFNLKEEDIIGKPIVEIIGRESIEKIQSQIERVFNGKRMHFKEHLKFTTGMETVLEATLIPVFDTEESVTGFYAVLSDITHHINNQRLLEESRNRLRTLSEHQQKMLEEERSYIAREVHDELGQNLTAIGMSLAMMKKHIPRSDRNLFSKVQELNHLTQTTLAKIKKISAELRPQLIDDMGLIAAIEWFVQNFEKRSGISCNLQIFAEETDIPKETAIHIYRILQEALTNVYKHAEATSMDVTLKKEEGNLKISIHDNGRGIQQEDIQKGNSFGIKGIEERVRLMKGSFNIQGNQEGTSIQISIPPYS